MNNLFLIIFSFLFPVSKNNFIENPFISVEMSFELKEETKKKRVYEIDFVLVNKKNKPLYYVASYEKISNSSQAQVSNFDKTDEINIANDNQSAPAPHSGSAYVDSGGAAQIGSESARSSNSNKVIKQDSKLGDDKKNPILSDIDFILNNDVFKINLDNSKSAKFFYDIDKNPNKVYFIKNKEKFNLGISSDNLTDNKINFYENSSDYNPVVCIIPADGLEKKAILETNKKNGVNPNDFFLSFSKNKFNISKLTLELDISYHESISDAIDKYLEMQKVLKENL